VPTLAYERSNPGAFPKIPFFLKLEEYYLRRNRLFLFSLICTSGCLWLTPAAAQNPGNAAKDTRYLALGDSVTFGYNPTVPVNLDNYHGYPEFVSDAVHEKVANASCVGESSGSFLKAGAPDLGCSQWKSSGLPMWVPYTGTQMDYAVAYLRSNPNPKLVTINIGGNDLGLLQESCAMDLACELEGLPAVLAAYGNNLFTIFSRLRVEAGYKGPIVILTYYAFDYRPASAADLAAFVALNGIASGVATAFGGKVADGFDAFLIASIPFGGDPCAAGLLVPLPGGTCDIHPTVAGQKVLANAVLNALKLKL
jgi:lysophospholipase L1-like esterase